MQLRIMTAGLCVLLAATAVQADHQQETRIKIEIDDDGSGAQTFVFDSQDAGFDLQSMLVGESRSITDRNGTTADVRRTERGFELDLNGKTIDLPGMSDESEVGVLIDSDDVDVTKDIKKVKVIQSGAANGITIISGPEINAAARQRIAEALVAAGHDGEIMYIDDESYDGARQAGSKRTVRIIRKEVDATN